MPCLHKIPSVRDPEVSQFFSNTEFQRSRKHNADNTIHCNIKQPFSLKKKQTKLPTYFPGMETSSYLMVWRQYEPFLNSNWRALSKLVFM